MPIERADLKPDILDEITRFIDNRQENYWIMLDGPKRWIKEKDTFIDSFVIARDGMAEFISLSSDSEGKGQTAVFAKALDPKLMPKSSFSVRLPLIPKGSLIVFGLGVLGETGEEVAVLYAPRGIRSADAFSRLQSAIRRVRSMK